MRKMKLNRIFVNLLLIVTLIFLIYVNIGLHVSGPNNLYVMTQNEMEQKIIEQVGETCEVSRHAYRYVTYSCIADDQAYFFDNESSEIVTKDYSQSNVTMAANIARNQYGLEAEPMLGYGIDNPVYVFENGEDILLLDYDTYEEVFYMKGTENEWVI